MNKNSITIILLLICLSTILSAQIDFRNDSMEEALDLAKKQGKSVFVDVYTTWCGPCKQLDRETFADPEVSAYMNDNFVSLKWDAESEEHAPTALAFDVNSFPTLLFLNSNGKIVAKHTGFKNNTEFLEIAKSFNKLISYEGVNGEILSPEKLSNEEQTAILLLLKDVKHESKEALFNSFYQELNVVNDTVLTICIDNFNVSNIHVFDKIVSNLQKPSSIDVTEVTKNIKREFKLRSKISSIKKNAIKQNDINLLGKTFEMDSLLNLKSASPRKLSEIEKEHQTSLLKFYKTNKLEQEYIGLAEDLVTRYITSHTTAAFKAEDERMYKMNSSVKKFMAKQEAEQDEKQEEVRYETKFVLSCRAAKRLVDISQTYLSFDKSNVGMVNQAIEWSKLATDLCPTAKNFKSYIHVLDAAGNLNEAISVTNEIIHKADFKEEIETFRKLLRELTGK